MSNYIEYKDKIAFHPGYYIQEIVDDSGLTQEDFSRRLDTTPKTLSLLLRGEQNLSIDISVKLSRLTGTSAQYWLNLQAAYDALIAEFKSEKELELERQIFKLIDYRYFRDEFGLPALPRRTDEQIREVRRFLKVSSLTVFRNPNLTVNFRSAGGNINESNTVKANIMVQIAINKALQTDAPKFDKDAFNSAIDYALTLTQDHASFYPLIRNAFQAAGVIFVMLPNCTGSRINGATKKLGKSILLMVNDRRMYSDTFWFTLFHEIGHIVHGDFGISLEGDNSDIEKKADRYAEDKLIPPDSYQRFLSNGNFTAESIRAFSQQINRAPGIVLGRLQKDGIVGRNDTRLNGLREKYKIVFKT